MYHSTRLIDLVRESWRERARAATARRRMLCCLQRESGPGLLASGCAPRLCGTMCIAGWFYSYFLLIENVDEGIFPRTRKASLGKVGASISDVTHSANHFDSRGSILRSGNNDDEGSNSNSDHGKFDVDRDSAGSANSNDENEIVRSGGILKDVDDENNNNSSDCIQVKRKPSGNRVQFKL